MDSSKRVNDFQNISAKSSIQNAKGYFNTLDVQNEQKVTENCLKRFKKEYSELMKQKHENIQSIKGSIKNNVKNSISSQIYSKSIESSNINVYPSDEFSISNLTELSSNNTIEIEEIDSNDTMSDSNIEMSQDLKQKKNSFSKNFLKKNNNKGISCKYNNYNDQYIDNNKHGKCNKEKQGCLHAESIIKNVPKNQKNENIQNHEGDCIKFYGMLDRLNNEIIKLKELFSTNTDSNSFCNTNFNNHNLEHNTNQSTDIIEMSAGEDFIDNEEYWSTQQNQQNTFVEQIVDAKYTDHDLYSESKFDTDQIIFRGVNHNNKDCTNTTNTHCSVHSYNPYYCD